MKNILIRITLCVMLIALVCVSVFAADVACDGSQLSLSELSASGIVAAGYDANGQMLFAKPQKVTNSTAGVSIPEAASVRIFPSSAENALVPCAKASAVLLQDGVSLQNGSFDTVLIAPTVQNGSVSLSNVEAERLVVQGGTGVALQNSSIASAVVETPVTVTGEGSIGELTAKASVTVDTSVVQSITVPEDASGNITLTLSGSGKVTLNIGSEAAITVTAPQASVEITADPEITPHVTVNGASTHIHQWVETSRSKPSAGQDGTIGYTCTADGCAVHTKQSVWAHADTMQELEAALADDSAAEVGITTPFDIDRPLTVSKNVSVIQQTREPIFIDVSADVFVESGASFGILIHTPDPQRDPGGVSYSQIILSEGGSIRAGEGALLFGQQYQSFAPVYYNYRSGFCLRGGTLDAENGLLGGGTEIDYDHGTMKLPESYPDSVDVFYYVHDAAALRAANENPICTGIMITPDGDENGFGSVVLDGDLTINKPLQLLWVDPQSGESTFSSLVIPEGTTLTVTNLFMSITLYEPSFQLAEFIVDGGTLDIQSPEYLLDGDCRITVSNGGTLKGAIGPNFLVNFTVNSVQELKAANEHPLCTQILLGSDIVLSEDYTVGKPIVSFSEARLYVEEGYTLHFDVPEWMEFSTDCIVGSYTVDHVHDWSECDENGRAHCYCGAEKIFVSDAQSFRDTIFDPSVRYITLASDFTLDRFDGGSNFYGTEGYKVIHVPEGVTLTIAPDCTLRLHDGSLVIDGLIAPLVENDDSACVSIWSSGRLIVSETGDVATLVEACEEEGIDETGVPTGSFDCRAEIEGYFTGYTMPFRRIYSNALLAYILNEEVIHRVELSGQRGEQFLLHEDGRTDFGSIDFISLIEGAQLTVDGSFYAENDLHISGDSSLTVNGDLIFVNGARLYMDDGATVTAQNVIDSTDEIVAALQTGGEYYILPGEYEIGEDVQTADETPVTLNRLNDHVCIRFADGCRLTVNNGLWIGEDVELDISSGEIYTDCGITNLGGLFFDGDRFFGSGTVCQRLSVADFAQRFHEEFSAYLPLEDEQVDLSVYFAEPECLAQLAQEERFDAIEGLKLLAVYALPEEVCFDSCWSPLDQDSYRALLTLLSGAICERFEEQAPTELEQFINSIRLYDGLFLGALTEGGDGNMHFTWQWDSELYQLRAYLPRLPVGASSYTVLRKLCDDEYCGGYQTEYHDFVNGSHDNTVRDLHFTGEVTVSCDPSMICAEENYGGCVRFENCAFDEDVLVNYCDGVNFRTEFVSCSFADGVKVRTLTEGGKPSANSAAELSFFGESCPIVTPDAPTRVFLNPESPVLFDGVMVVNGQQEGSEATAELCMNCLAEHGDDFDWETNDHSACEGDWSYAYHFTTNGYYDYDYPQFLVCCGTTDHAYPIRVSGVVHLYDLIPADAQELEINSWNRWYDDETGESGVFESFVIIGEEATAHVYSDAVATVLSGGGTLVIHNEDACIRFNDMHDMPHIFGDCGGVFLPMDFMPDDIMLYQRVWDGEEEKLIPLSFKLVPMTNDGSVVEEGFDKLHLEPVPGEPWIDDPSNICLIMDVENATVVYERVPIKQLCLADLAYILLDLGIDGEKLSFEGFEPYARCSYGDARIFLQRIYEAYGFEDTLALREDWNDDFRLNEGMAYELAQLLRSALGLDVEVWTPEELLAVYEAPGSARIVISADALINIAELDNDGDLFVDLSGRSIVCNGFFDVPEGYTLRVGEFENAGTGELHIRETAGLELAENGTLRNEGYMCLEGSLVCEEGSAFLNTGESGVEVTPTASAVLTAQSESSGPVFFVIVETVDDGGAHLGYNDSFDGSLVAFAGQNARYEICAYTIDGLYQRPEHQYEYVVLFGDFTVTADTEIAATLVVRDGILNVKNAQLTVNGFLVGSSDVTVTGSGCLTVYGDGQSDTPILMADEQLHAAVSYNDRHTSAVLTALEPNVELGIEEEPNE